MRIWRKKQWIYECAEYFHDDEIMIFKMIQTIDQNSSGKDKAKRYDSW